ncbi:MAG: NUDIX hydrolase [Acidimicrobiales bacterium]
MPDSTNPRWYPDVWDTPGGHVDASETLAVAVQKELRAELGRTSHPGSTTQPRTCRSAHGWSRSGPENSPTLPPRSTLRSSGLGWKTFVDSNSLKAASESASCSLGLNMRPAGTFLTIWWPRSVPNHDGIRKVGVVDDTSASFRPFLSASHSIPRAGTPGASMTVIVRPLWPSMTVRLARPEPSKMTLSLPGRTHGRRSRS